MGKYDGPQFSTDDCVVSVWISHVPFSVIPADYWLHDWEDDSDDSPWNKFSSDFGFGYYNDDSVEAYCEEAIELSVYDLSKYFSYSKSFINQVVAKANTMGIVKSSYIFLIYDFKYDPVQTSKHKSDYLTFFGVFEYDDESESECEWHG